MHIEEYCWGRLELDLVGFGDCVVDILFKMPANLPVGKGDIILADAFATQCGGTCTTLIMASRLGLKVGAIDAVGSDPFGGFIVETLRGEGIDVSHLRRGAGKSTTVIVLIDEEGDFAFLGMVDEGLKLPLTEADLTYLEAARALYTTGYALLMSATREVTVKALKRAETSGIEIFFDPGPVSYELVSKALSYVDYLLANESELLNLFSSPSLDEVVDRLVGEGKTVVVKRGRQGCLVARGRRRVAEPALEVEEASPIGAGDCFNGAFIAGVLRGLDLEGSALLANAAGAAKVRRLRLGAVDVPTRDEIASLLEERVGQTEKLRAVGELLRC